MSRTRVALLAVIALSTAGLVFAGTVIARQALAPAEPLATQGSTTQNPDVFQVDGVPHDGDTFRVAITLATRGGNVMPQPPMTQPVRILGIDTPEIPPAASPAQCMGEQAAAATQQLLEGKQVTLQADPAQGDQDRYGRWLRYAGTTDIPDVGAYLISGGYARVYESYPVARTPGYRHLQDQAKADHVGGWAVCGW